MSFDFNNDPESKDEEDLEHWSRKHGFLDPKSDVATTTPSIFSGEIDPNLLWTGEKGDTDDEDDQVEWQDAENEIVGPEVVGMNPPHTSTTRTSRKRKRRNFFRLETLSKQDQALLWGLHHSHILVLSSRAVQLSYIASADMSLSARALSLVPAEYALQEFHSFHPTMIQVKSLVKWYSTWARTCSDRRQQRMTENRAAGAPVVTKNHCNSYDIHENASIDIKGTRQLARWITWMSSADVDDPQLVSTPPVASNNEDQHQLIILLLIAMTRAMGWRVRWVQAMDTIPMDGLTVDHPLVSVMLESGRNTQKAKPNVTVIPDSQKQSSVVLDWVEIYCRDNEVNRKTPSALLQKHAQGRWVHVNPFKGAVDQPENVEQEWKDTCCLKRTKNVPIISYVVAVEHRVNTTNEAIELSSPSPPLRRQIVDVTPRYVKSFVATLKKRGLIRGSSRLHDHWWTNTLRELNLEHTAEQDILKFQLCMHRFLLVHHIIMGSKSLVSTKNVPAGESYDGSSIVNGESDQDIPSKLTGFKVESRYIPTPSKVNTTRAVLTDRPRDWNFAKQSPQHLKSLLMNNDVVIDKEEFQELTELAEHEDIPTSKTAFQSHPVYVIPSVLGSSQVIDPEAKICGMFKGERVFKRSDMSTALTDRKWLYRGRRVMEGVKPVKRVKARKRPDKPQFRALETYTPAVQDVDNEAKQESDEDELYAYWQTEAWSPPPVGPNDPLPVNHHNNIELALLNPGLVHIDMKGAAKVAKKLGIPYAPCLLGFEGSHQGVKPTIRGIIVHEGNQDIVQEGATEVHLFEKEKEEDRRRSQIMLRWKKLLVGLLTKERIDREYGGNEGKKC